MDIPIPIAVIGMGCRLPGGADSPEKLWNNLAAGRQAWKDVPEDRWNWRSFYHPEAETRDTHNARGGYFVEGDIAEFDAGFFHVPGIEAQAMDPQHRIQLEVVYEALEGAGISMESLRGSDTAVFTAVTGRDYDRMAYKDTQDLPKYHLTGVGEPALCGRISYILDLHGPSVTVDTGCSGSLVCLHQACLSIRSGESSMAIVGGTNLLLGPDITIVMSQLNMINDDGRCYAFDSRGAGYGRAEGVAAVILKRLDDAVAAGDPIRAIIRNTGVNSDGKTNGILLPSSYAQQRLMRSLYHAAKIDPRHTGYVEAHGTGTEAGDNAEMASITSIFSREDGDSVFVGSIKANIGHSEPTSGLAGLIKTVLMLEKGLIPPVPGIETLKDGLNLGPGVKIPIVLEKWPNPGRRIASINSFGYGGTNAHCIIESFELANETVGGTLPSFGGSGVASSPQLFVLSAMTKLSLQSSLENLKRWISTPGRRVDFSSVSYTLCTRRSAMLWRRCIVASDPEELATSVGLRSSSFEKSYNQTQTVFLFTGQGAQWHAMGRELIDGCNAFAESISKSTEILRELGCIWSLRDELTKDKADSRLDESAIAQPATTAIQIGLVDLLRTFDIRPAAVIGHSSGEIAAAYSAGHLTQETAMRVSYQRGFVSQRSIAEVAEKGAMLAVGLSENDALSYMADIQSGIISIACVNSPTSATVSGDEPAIDELKAILDAASVFNRKLRVDTAYHSHHMKTVADEYLQSLQGIQDVPATGTRFFSSVTGHQKQANFDAPYWTQNLVSKVRYSDTLERLILQMSQGPASSAHKVLIEVGPHGALAGPTRQIISQPSLNGYKYSYLSCLSRGTSALETVLGTVGTLFEKGVSVSLGKVSQLSGPRSRRVIADLPPYHWDHSERYWNESRLSRDYRFRAHPPDELLGSRVVATSILEPTWRNVISAESVPWIRDHVIDNFALTTGTVFLYMAMQAFKQITSDRRISAPIEKFSIKDVIYSKALLIPERPGKVEVQLTLRSSGNHAAHDGISRQEFRVSSVSSNGTWTEHCRGTIAAEFATEDEVDDQRQDERSTEESKQTLEHVRQHCQESVDPDTFYQSLRENGVDFGPHFALLEDVRLGNCNALGSVTVPDISKSMPGGHQQPHTIHPVTLDALMHIVLPLYSRHCSDGAVMLVSLDEVTISSKVLSQPGTQLLTMCNLLPLGRHSARVDWSMFQQEEFPTPTPVMSVVGGRFQGIGGASKKNAGPDLTSACLSKQWSPVTDHTRASEPIQYSNGHCTATLPLPTGGRSVSLLTLNADASCMKLQQNLGALLGSMGFECILKSARTGSNICHATLTIDSGKPSNENVIVRTDTGNTTSTEQPGALLWVSIVADSGSRFESLFQREKRRVQMQQVGKIFASIDVESVPQDDKALARSITNVLVGILGTGSDITGMALEYVYRDDEMVVSSILPSSDMRRWVDGCDSPEDRSFSSFEHTEQPLKLHVETPGLLSSLIFRECEDGNLPLRDSEVMVRPAAFGVNQDDVAMALGRAKASTTMTGEFAGTILAAGAEAAKDFSPGDRVFGWSRAPFASFVRLETCTIQQLPSAFNFVQGASAPFAFALAYQALFEVAGLKQGQTVLIHNAAGAVGQAGVMLATSLGARVFATVETAAQRQHLIGRHKVLESRVFSTRKLVFKSGILKETCGEGVDVVLNSLTGEALTESWACVADFGTFVEIGDPGKHHLPLERLERNISFVSVDMGLLTRRRPGQLRRVLGKIARMLDEGEIQPLSPVVEMSLSDIDSAFRQVQAGKLTGKLVLTTKDALVPTQPAKMQKTHLDCNATYIIVGGTAQLNRTIARFMNSKGAGALILITENSSSNSATEDPVAQTSCDQKSSFRQYAYSSLEDLEEILRSIQASTKICGGVIHVDDAHPAHSALIPTTGERENKKLDQIKVLRCLQTLCGQGKAGFFIQISYLEEIMGERMPQGGVVAQSFKNAWMRNKRSPGMQHAHLVVGVFPVVGSDSRQWPLAGSCESKQDTGVRTEHFLNLLGYAMQMRPKSGEYNEFYLGVQPPSLRSGEWFCELPVSNAVSSDNQDTGVLKTKPNGLTARIEAAQTYEKVHETILEAVMAKIAALIAIDEGEIDVEGPMSNLGLDSLVAIEFKNWVAHTLKAPMQTNEILDASSLHSFVVLVAQRSDLVEQSHGGNPDEHPEINGNGRTATHVMSPSEGKAYPNSLQLPRLPLPRLGSFLDTYLESIRAVCSDEELGRSIAAIEQFKEIGGIGQELQRRLEAREADPSTHGWVYESFLRESHLDRRGPLSPAASFFYTHPLGRSNETQAQRAALVTATAFAHKQKIEAGEFEQQYLNEQPVDMHLFDWIFNSTQRPMHLSDEVYRFPGNDFIVVLLRGHAFKMDLRKDGQVASLGQIQRAFQHMIDRQQSETEWLGIMTACDRPTWAKLREVFRASSSENELYLSTMDRAAFIVCLDDASPTTASGRARQCHFGDGSNRWHDKLTQFAVCRNGVSALVGIHCMLDAATISPVNSEIRLSIESLDAESFDDAPGASLPQIDYQEIEICVPPVIQDEIIRVRAEYNQTIDKYEHGFWTFEGYGGEYFRQLKFAPKSAWQIIIQLAGREYFGRQEYCWETVSTAHFHRARLEINPVTWPAVAEFCAATADTDAPSTELRQLFLEACRTHSNSVYQASQGRGSEKHYQALRWELREDDPKPLLFTDLINPDKIHRWRFMSSCFQSDMMEKGCLLGGDDDHMWVHYEVFDDRVRFNLTAPPGRTSVFWGLVVKAAETVRALLQATA